MGRLYTKAALDGISYLGGMTSLHRVKNESANVGMGGAASQPVEIDGYGGGGCKRRSLDYSAVDGSHRAPVLYSQTGVDADAQAAGSCLSRRTTASWRVFSTWQSDRESRRKLATIVSGRRLHSLRVNCATSRRASEKRECTRQPSSLPKRCARCPSCC